MSTGGEEAARLARLDAIEAARRARHARLPRWAREKIELLERDLGAARATLAAGSADSDTFAEPYTARRPLGRGTMIQFGPADHAFHVELDDGELSVRGHSLRASRLAVMPGSSNAVHIRLV